MKDAEEFLAEMGIETEKVSTPQESSSQKVSALEASWDEDFLLPFDGKKSQLAQLQQDLQKSALRLLSQREHGDKELLGKLKRKFGTEAKLHSYAVSDSELAEQLRDCLAYCQEQNWQSDDRYIEQLVSVLSAKGQGPMKIRQKAQMTSSKSDLVADFLDDDKDQLLEQMRELLHKKYGVRQGRLEQKEQARQMRFLQSRGYSPDLIWRLFR